MPPTEKKPAPTVLGLAACPVCHSPRSTVRLSSQELAYLVCQGCNIQIFARSGRGDELLRKLITAAPAPAPAPVAPAAPAANDEARGKPAPAKNDDDWDPFK